MIALDTNVVIELLRAPTSPVAAWARAQEDRLVVTAITLAEVEGAVRAVPGMRRVAAGTMWASVRRSLGDHVLTFDEAAALRFGELTVELERAGLAPAVLDVQTAAICRAHGARLSTLTPDAFAGTGIEVLDPSRPRA